MGKIMRALLGFFCSLLMLGCQQSEFGLEKLTKGVSTEADVRSAMGEPEVVWEEHMAPVRWSIRKARPVTVPIWWISMHRASCATTPKC